jgi:hypothetical protein
VAWLQQNDWTAEREQAFVDVVANRRGVKILAEAKGRTTSPGLDMDTMYGQLLRRIPPEEVGRAHLAVVVPDDALKFALRVHEAVRDALNIHVYAVSEAGTVGHFGARPDPIIAAL